MCSRGSSGQRPEPHPSGGRPQATWGERAAVWTLSVTKKNHLGSLSTSSSESSLLFP